MTNETLEAIAYIVAAAGGGYLVRRPHLPGDDRGARFAEARAEVLLNRLEACVTRLEEAEKKR